MKIATPLANALSLTSSQRLVVAVGAHDAQHRTKDLVGVDRHRRCDAIEEARSEEEPAFVASDAQSPAVLEEFGARGLTLLDVRHHAREVLARDERSHVGARLEP